VRTFIRRDGVTTATGYPLQIAGGSRPHLRTLLVVRYRRDNELCSAAAAAAAAAETGGRRARRQVPRTGDGPGSRRRRRQAAFDDSRMSQDLINTILAGEDRLVGRGVIKVFTDRCCDRRYACVW